jgi:AraC-like DNA-binding protein
MKIQPCICMSNVNNMKPVMVQAVEGKAVDAPFTLKSVPLHAFSKEFQFHEECLLIYVSESKGRRIVGDSIAYFQDDELVFLGSNVPYAWYNSTYRSEGKMEVRSGVLALYFKPGVLLEHISKLIDTTPIEQMLRLSGRGMKFHGEAKRRLVNLLLHMQDLNELQKFSRLIKILELICETKEFSYLASAGYVNSYRGMDNSRMDRISKYIMDHFREEISLADIAKVANLSVQAFCRYFKARTQRTFTQVVNEIRVSHACKLLLSPEESITDIARKSGFGSVSNFNSFFKEIKGMTPREFKKTLKI